jgi:hypothetical protein
VNETAIKSPTAVAAPLAVLAGVAGLLVPGLGHLVLRRPVRALAFFLAVGALAITGYVLRGSVFEYHAGDPFNTLGFLADASSGVFFYLARFFEKSGADVSRAAGDYGTRFIATAGVLNILCALDAYEIGMGRKG